MGTSAKHVFLGLNLARTTILQVLGAHLNFRIREYTANRDFCVLLSACIVLQSACIELALCCILLGSVAAPPSHWTPPTFPLHEEYVWVECVAVGAF